MGTEQQLCYTDPTGENIYLFTLRNARDTVVKITNYGATITSFSISRIKGDENDIVLGFDDVRDYLSPAYLEQYPWFGSAVGRYANRIRNAAFVLDEKKYELTKNRGEHQLHGGPEGFDRRIWKFHDRGDSPHPFLEMHYLSVDGEEGYPGNLSVTVRFELNNEDELSYEYTATTDHATPCNLTHHGYFNLDNGQGDILDHEIRIHASHFLEQDADLVATGNIFPVSGTPYDLREYTKIRKGLDHIPEFDKSYITERNNRELQLVAELRFKPKDILLQVLSTEPIVHFYSGKWIPEVQGKNGKRYGPWSGLCLETHRHPNAVNIPHFPDTVLRPQQVYRQKTVYRVIQHKIPPD